MPPIVERAGPLLSRYAALICDVWGVLHDGHTAYPAAGAALAQFRSEGGKVVLLSNSPMPSDAVVHVLDEKGVRRDAYDAIVTSGDLARAHLQERGIASVHHIGAPRDLVLFEKTSLRLTNLTSAEAIVCTGLVDDANETGESYRPLLQDALRIGLPFVCANPDLVVDVGDERLPCAGTLAALYEEMGGAVTWAGKPHALAYERALTTLAALNGGPMPQDQIVTVGDALRTDIAGAAAAGLDAIFVAGGLHRDEVTTDGHITPERLALLLRNIQPDVTRRIVATVPQLAW